MRNPEEHEITGFRGPVVENEAKIVDLRDFFVNTRCCGKTCKKIAYMVKFGREEGMLRPFFSCKGLFEKQVWDSESDKQDFVFLQLSVIHITGKIDIQQNLLSAIHITY